MLALATTAVIPAGSGSSGRETAHRVTRRTSSGILTSSLPNAGSKTSPAQSGHTRDRTRAAPDRSDPLREPPCKPPLLNIVRQVGQPPDQIPQNQSVLVVGGGRAWYTVALRPVSTAPTTLYRSLPGGFVALKWPEPFCESMSKRSDCCNCKGFGARSRIRTDDLLFTRQLL